MNSQMNNYMNKYMNIYDEKYITYLDKCILYGFAVSHKVEGDIFKQVKAEDFNEDKVMMKIKILVSFLKQT